MKKEIQEKLDKDIELYTKLRYFCGFIIDELDDILDRLSNYEPNSWDIAYNKSPHISNRSLWRLSYEFYKKILRIR